MNALCFAVTCKNTSKDLPSHQLEVLTTGLCMWKLMRQQIGLHYLRAICILPDTVNTLQGPFISGIFSLNNKFCHI